MLKETKTEETIGFVVIIFVIGGISIGRGTPGPPWLRLFAQTIGRRPNLKTVFGKYGENYFVQIKDED